MVLLLSLGKPRAEQVICFRQSFADPWKQNGYSEKSKDDSITKLHACELSLCRLVQVSVSHRKRGFANHHRHYK